MSNNTLDHTDRNNFSTATLPLLPASATEQAVHTVWFISSLLKQRPPELPPLEISEEHTEKFESHNKKAQQAAHILARTNLRLGLQHLQSYRADTSNDDWNALIQTAFEALEYAAWLYNPRHFIGAKYTTYASNWVRQKTKSEFSRNQQLQPDGTHMYSLEHPIGMSQQGNNVTLQDRISDPTAASTFDSVDLASDISGYMKKLPYRERIAISIYFGLEQYKNKSYNVKSYQQVGEIMDISGETARKAVNDGLTRIKNAMEANTIAILN